MLGKMIKYDLKSSVRVFILIHAVFIAICAGGRIFFMDRIDFNAPARVLVAPISIAFTTAIFLIAAISLCTSLMITVRFYRNLFGKESYLTWTLPVSGIQHLWAKIISGCILAVIDIVVIGAGILLLVTGGNVMEAYTAVKPEIIETLGLPLGTFALYIFIFSVIGSISSVLMIYFCICVGQLFPGHHALYAVAIYFISSFVIQIITLVIMVATGQFDFYEANTGLIANHALSLLIPIIVFALILTVAEYIAAHYIMKKRINLI